MQAMKAREVEHVRYISAVPAKFDSDLQRTTHCQCTEARDEIRQGSGSVDLVELSKPPGSASVDPIIFFKAWHEESLRVTALKDKKSCRC